MAVDTPLRSVDMHPSEYAYMEIRPAAVFK